MIIEQAFGGIATSVSTEAESLEPASLSSKIRSARAEVMD